MNLTQINENIVRIKKSGEIIIPVKLREYFSWLGQDGLIKAKPTKDGLLLQPVEPGKQSLIFRKLENKKTLPQKTAKEILKEFAKHRKYDKNPDVSLTKFVIQDRQNH